MVIRPEDRPKIILLSLAIVAVMAYIVFTLRSRFVARSAAPTPVAVFVPRPAASSGATEAVTGSESGGVVARRAPNPADVDVEGSIPPAPARDPFKPPVSTRVTSGSPRPSVPPRASVRPGPRPALPVFEYPGSGLPRSGDLPPAEVAPPLPAVALKGVITGDPAIAVVEIDGQTFYKQEGESLGHSLSLRKISEAGVVIQRSLPRGRKNYILAVGHSLPTGLPRTGTPSAPAPGASEDNAPPSRLVPTSDRSPVTPQPAEAPLRPAARPLATGGNTPSHVSRPTTSSAAETVVRRPIRRRAPRKRRSVRRYRRPAPSTVPYHFTGRRL